MKKPWIIIFCGLLTGLAAYACVYLAGTSSERAMSKGDKSALARLQLEYHLDDAQFAQIQALYAAYYPKCLEMCRRIAEKNAGLHKLLSATNVVTPEIRKALAEAAELRAECQGNMLAHFYAVAQIMPPDQGQRYLAWVQQETLTPGPMISTRQPSSTAAQTP